MRELQNCLERAVILADGETIYPKHLNLHAEDFTPPANPLAHLDFSGSLADVTQRAVAEVERQAIRQALPKHATSDRARRSAQIGCKLLQAQDRLQVSTDFESVGGYEDCRTRPLEGGSAVECLCLRFDSPIACSAAFRFHYLASRPVGDIGQFATCRRRRGDEVQRARDDLLVVRDGADDLLRRQVGDRRERTELGDELRRRGRGIAAA